MHQYRSRVWPQGRRCGGVIPQSTAECAGIVSGREAVWRLPDGKAVNGFSRGYKRHGTTTLFAALEITTGLVKAAHYPRRRRREFLDFMNEIVAAHPDCEIHVVLDNLNTHKPKDDRWLKRHPGVHFQFIPTYSS